MDPVKALNQPIRIAGSDAQMVRWEGFVADKREGEKTEVHAGLGRMVQVHGEFDGASILMETSLDGNHWLSLIEIEEPSIEAIPQDARYIRPVVIAPTRKTNLTVILMMRRLA